MTDPEPPPVDEGLREALARCDARVATWREWETVSASEKDWPMADRWRHMATGAEDALGIIRAALASPAAPEEKHEHHWVDGHDDEAAWHCPSCGVTEYPGDEFDPEDEVTPEGLDEVQAALSEGWSLMVGYTTECPFCPGWWATASKRPESPADYSKIVTSESDRVRGSHHDATSAEAVRALLTRLSAKDRRER